MSLTIKDVPKENLFGIGVIQQTTENDGYHFANCYHFANPRRPFVINRGEALNVIGYLITHGDLQPKMIDDAVTQDMFTIDPFRTQGDNLRVLIQGPISIFIITPNEGLQLIAALIRVMGLAPSELDAAAAAIGEYALGQTNADVAKHMH